jgi:hypothetical protein
MVAESSESWDNAKRPDETQGSRSSHSSYSGAAANKNGNKMKYATTLKRLLFFDILASFSHKLWEKSREQQILILERTSHDPPFQVLAI